MTKPKNFPMSKFIVHLLSGGMDSVVMLYDLHAQGHKLHCLIFDYGQKHSREIEFAKAHCFRLGLEFTVLNLPGLRGSALTDGTTNGFVVPNRNAIFLSHAVNVAAAAGADTITYACNKDDEANFPDCRQSFVDAMNAAVQAAGYQIEICAPYIERSKWWIGGRARELGMNLSDTWSCYAGGERPCETCPACIKRKEALA